MDGAARESRQRYKRWPLQEVGNPIGLSCRRRGFGAMWPHVASRFNVIRNAGRFGHREPVFPQSRHVKPDRLAKFVLHGLHGRPSSNASRQVGHIGRVVCLRFFDHDRVAHYRFSFRPACFKMLCSVPGARSSEGFPAIVTRPGLRGCLNCRWLPRIATRNQPSSSIIHIASRTFMSRPRWRRYDLQHFAASRMTGDPHYLWINSVFSRDPESAMATLLSIGFRRPALAAFNLCLALTASAAAAPVEPVHSLAAKEKAPLIETLKGLVSIESGSGDREGLDKIADVIAGRLKALGGAVEMIEPDPADIYRMVDTPKQIGKMVQARFTGAGTKKILLIAHMDTVYLRGMGAQQPFRIDGNRAYGLGIADDKHGVALILHTLAILREMNFGDYGLITVLINGDEEVSSPVARATLTRLGGEHD